MYIRTAKGDLQNSDGLGTYNIKRDWLKSTVLAYNYLTQALISSIAAVTAEFNHVPALDVYVVFFNRINIYME